MKCITKANKRAEYTGGTKPPVADLIRITTYFIKILAKVFTPMPVAPAAHLSVDDLR